MCRRRTRADTEKRGFREEAYSRVEGCGQQGYGRGGWRRDSKRKAAGRGQGQRQRLPRSRDGNTRRCATRCRNRPATVQARARWQTDAAAAAAAQRATRRQRTPRASEGGSKAPETARHGEGAQAPRLFARLSPSSPILSPHRTTRTTPPRDKHTRAQEAAGRTVGSGKE